MKTRNFLLLGMCAFAASAMAQSPRIVLQGSGEPQVFLSFEDAYAAAQPNDKLYFSGGSFSSGPGDLIVDKPLHWIGAGISFDSTNVTAQTIFKTTDGHIRFTTAAGGSSFTGIEFFPYRGDASNGKYLTYGSSINDDAPQNMVFERCSFNCLVGLAFINSSTPPGSSTTFNDCKFFNGVSGGGITTTTFTRCDISGQFKYFQPSGLFVDHSLLRTRLWECDGFIVKNSIILSGSEAATQCSGSMSNCLLVGGYVGNSVSAQNIIYSQPLESIFVNDADGVFQWSDDVHLAPGSPGIGAADDGTDIGIYGSPAPSKMGVVPYNPHFSEAIIDPSTNSNGELPVNIRVIAQPY